MNEWLPIETAPNDWSWFLGYLDGEYAVVRKPASGFAEDDWQPTHWMPLPDPPTP